MRNQQSRTERKLSLRLDRTPIDYYFVEILQWGCRATIRSRETHAVAPRPSSNGHGYEDMPATDQNMPLDTPDLPRLLVGITGDQHAPETREEPAAR